MILIHKHFQLCLINLSIVLDNERRLYKGELENILVDKKEQMKKIPEDEKNLIKDTHLNEYDMEKEIIIHKITQNEKELMEDAKVREISIEEKKIIEKIETEDDTKANEFCVDEKKIMKTITKDENKLIEETSAKQIQVEEKMFKEGIPEDQTILKKETTADNEQGIKEELLLNEMPIEEKKQECILMKEVHTDNAKVVEEIKVDEQKLREFLSNGELTICHVRCIIVGCKGAGKTTLLRRLENVTFEELMDITSTEMVDVQANSFEVLEDEETIQSKLLLF